MPDIVAKALQRPRRAGVLFFNATRRATLRNDAAEFAAFDSAAYAYEPYDTTGTPSRGHSAVRHGGPRYDATTGLRKAT